MRLLLTIFIVLLAATSTVEQKFRIILQITPANVKVAANVVKFIADSDQAVVFQSNSKPEDSRIVDSCKNSFVIGKQGYERFLSQS